MGRVIFLDKGSVSVDRQSLLLGSRLPMAAVINHRKLGGLNQEIYYLTALKVRIPTWISPGLDHCVG